MAFPTTSLELRYEAKDETAYTDGQEATSVTDQSANGFDLPGTGLTWESGELNSHAVYRLDGIDDGAEDTTVALPNPTALSVAVLCKSAAEATSRLWPFAISDTTDAISGFTEGETASEWGIFFRTSAGTEKIFTSGVDTTAWTTLLLVWDGATVTFYRDGPSVGSASLAGTIDWEDIYLGSFVDQFFGGDIALAAAWSKALDSTERTDLQDYVDTTYFPSGGTTVTPSAIGLSATLPSSTPAGAASTSPAATSAGLTIPSSTPAGAASSSPSAIVSSVVVPQPSAEGGGSVSPAATALTANLHAVTTAAGGNPGSVTPAELTAQLSMAQATPVGAANVTPTALSAALNLPAVTAEGLTLVSPAALVTAVSVGQVALVGGATVTVDALQLEVVFGAAVTGEPIDHLTGKTGVTLDASTTDAGIVASITSVSLDESRTHVTLDKTRTDT